MHNSGSLLGQFLPLSRHSAKSSPTQMVSTPALCFCSSVNLPPADPTISKVMLVDRVQLSHDICEGLDPGSLWILNRCKIS